ncbi:MAG: hypothetical protein DRP99_02305 [Candidatus Latescibacterota bacterium]|nr:MAG: hypothetical protein DRP99_02305 [Candidatus Latescibacterota bacterium]
MRYAVGILTLALMVGVAYGHLYGPNGEGNPYYMPAVPDEYIPTIDGDLSDWAWLPSQFVFTPDWFATIGQFTDQEAQVPKDDFDVIVYGPVWIPSMNMVAFAIHKVDDILYAPHEEIRHCWDEDVVQWAVDADHGGEDAGDGNDYQQCFFTPKQGGHVGVFQGGGTVDWIYTEPYAYWAAKIQDNGSFDFEIMMTLWDWADATGPDASTKHMLKAGEIIGFSVEVCDADSDSEIEFPDVEFDYGNIAVGGSVLPDWLLMPVEETLKLLPVGSDTWGRIKASFK